MNSTALATTPSSDRTTRYISVWADHTIEELKSKRLQFIVLSKERSTADTFASMLKKHNQLSHPLRCIEQLPHLIQILHAIVPICYD